MYYVSPYYRMPDYFCNNPLLFSFVVTYAVLVNNEREDSESDIVNLIPQFVPSTLILPLLVILKIVGNCRDVDTINVIVVVGCCVNYPSSLLVPTFRTLFPLTPFELHVYSCLK